MASVSFRDVRKSYTPELQVIHGVTMEIKDGGEVLLMRGYWGLFWRTQKWRRQPS